MNTIKTEQAWHDYRKELRVFILSRVKDLDEADDILQEVFLKVHLHLADLKEESRLKSWIYQITRNTIQDYFRKKRFSLNIEEIELSGESETRSDTVLNNCIAPFIGQLPGKYREALVLSDLKRMNQKNLAQKLSMSYSGLKSRVQRARQLLHTYLTDCCDIKADKYGNIVSQVPKGKCICDTC
ncbi:MAG: RNA polymerase sigma factor SigZ [Bacteroidia bacterium]|nr:RNA polymerase sigma factor SigZ [Bacteroidia bacterium]